MNQPQAAADPSILERYAPHVAVLGVALFWIGIFVAAALEPNYASRDDYVSSLASRGSTVAPIGIAAIASMGTAFIAGAVAAQRAWGRRALSIPTALSGAALLVVAACRIRCPLGAAGCGFGANDAASDWLDRAHVYGVAFNELFLVGAMAALAFGPLRCAPWPRWLGNASVPLAVASIVLLRQTGEADNGLYQRLWVAVNAGWLLLTVWAAVRRLRGGGRGPGESCPQPQGRPMR